MKRRCPSCNCEYDPVFPTYEIAMLFGTPEEREYWLSGLCAQCQSAVFDEKKKK